MDPDPDLFSEFDPDPSTITDTDQETRLSTLTVPEDLII
jgi:hypothetical protein